MRVAGVPMDTQLNGYDDTEEGDERYKLGICSLSLDWQLGR